MIRRFASPQIRFRVLSTHSHGGIKSSTYQVHPNTNAVKNHLSPQPSDMSTAEPPPRKKYQELKERGVNHNHTLRKGVNHDREYEYHQF